MSIFRSRAAVGMTELSSRRAHRLRLPSAKGLTCAELLLEPGLSHATGPARRTALRRTDSASPTPARERTLRQPPTRASCGLDLGTAPNAEDLT